jgi:oligoribonuclease
MKYVSLDIETTGLNPDTCQVLQIAAVFDDTSKPLEEAKIFNSLVRHPIYQGEPYALQLNAEIFYALSNETLANSSGKSLFRGHEVQRDPISHVATYLQCWLKTLPISGKALLAGKNVSSFDLAFLRKLPNWSDKYFAHRVLDVGPLYVRPTDTYIPSTEECIRRAFLPDVVTHDAVDDALLVCSLIRCWEKRYEEK